MHARALLIFIKNPLSGKVKTRLAATIGEEKALRIYLQLLQITRNTTLQADCARYLFYSDFIDTTDDWLPEDFHKALQHGDDLGQRMYEAFRSLLEHYTKAIIIGSDCPELGEEILNLAFNKLDESDIVLGPAVDGGYYLLGMKELTPELFEGIAWSTPEVMNQTLKKIKSIDKTVAFCPTLRDLDDEADWEMLKDIIDPD